MLIDKLCSELLPMAASHTVTDVRIGLGYTCVQLENGRSGLAYTFRHRSGEGCCVIKEAGSLSGSSAAELAAWAGSSDVIAAAVGLATLNALIEPPVSSGGDILDLLKVGSEDTVGMVGFFGPLVAPLKTAAKALHVLETREDLGSSVLPADSYEQILPECQVVIVTATALLNRTIDSVLDCCRNAREIAILGPTTPLWPSLFAPRGITVLSGMQVVNSQLALRVVSEGGGTHQLLRATRKVSIRT